MNRIQPKLLIIAFIIFAFAQIAPAQTTTFTYQGRLTDSSAQANGTYDLGFALFAAASGGTQIGAAQTRAAVNVTNGLFTVQLDFGANGFLSGANRFLEIAVKRPSDANFTTLTPRQQLTSAPFSIQSLSAQAANGLSANCVACVTNGQINSVDGSKITGLIDGSKITGTVAKAANAQTATSAQAASTAGNVTGIVAIANGGTGSATKNFVDTTTAQTVAGAKTFADNLRTSGLIRAGNETGTTETPDISSSIGTYNGLVTRRINSTESTAGQIVARTNVLRLERDDTAGGWRIANDALSNVDFVQSVYCLGTNNAGAVITARVQLRGGAARTTQLYTNAQNIEFMQCSFGNSNSTGHLTKVVVQRAPNDLYWVGTVTSTFNQ